MNIYCSYTYLREISDMEVNKPILTLKRKPRQTSLAAMPDKTVVIKHPRTRAVPELMKQAKSRNPKKPRTSRLMPITQAYTLLTLHWPALFDITYVRLMKIYVLQALSRIKNAESLPYRTRNSDAV